MTKLSLYDKPKTATPNGPERYFGISHTQLSIARHYGGMTVNGTDYVYLPDTDELLRHDIWKKELKEAKGMERERRKWHALLLAEADEESERLKQKLSP